MTKQWLFVALFGVALLSSLAFVQARENGEADPSQETAQAQDAPAIDATEQPIQFPHDKHAGDFQIDCQYCHFSAERSSSAGIPPVATCMGCHAVISGSDAPEEITKVRDYWERREAIPWVRIYRVSDHVQFPHMRHVAAGVDCASCHGNVEEMGVIQAVEQELTMGWCVNCHIEERASIDCAVCHY